MSIDLTPELESALAAEARERGTTPELLAQEFVRRELRLAQPYPNGEKAETLADFLSGYVGVFDSRDDLPGGAHLSEDPGKKFAEGMVRKRAQGHL